MKKKTMFTESQKIANEIFGRIKNVTMRIESDEQKLQQDFALNFPWVCEDLWTANFQRDTYKYWLHEFETSNETWQDFVQRELNHWKTFCSRPSNVRTNSTGALHREVSTWKFQCALEFIAILETLLNYKNA